MNRFVFAAAFALGLAAVLWVGWGFVGSASWLALAMTAAIALVYLLGAMELTRFRGDTSALQTALAGVQETPAELGHWLDRVPVPLRSVVRLRVEGERAALPGPGLTPYLVGLLVMLGMLGTFLGMIVTFNGAVFALEGSSDLQAIRSALAAPIKGLGLSFGTSVAGVATSAMLGLMSALSRRERLTVSRLLDAQAATVLRPFSQAHQRQETFNALQVQALAMPQIVDRLQGLMDGLERRTAQLNEQLLGNQQQFHREVSVAYADLAGAVGRSLQDSLVAGAQAAGESLTPVVRAAMADIAQESQRAQQQLVQATQAQLEGLSAQFEGSTRAVANTWASALHEHSRTSDSLVQGLERSVHGWVAMMEQRSAAVLGAVEGSIARARADQAAADTERLQAWAGTLQATAAAMVDQWQQRDAQALAQQQGVTQALEQAAAQITQQAGEQSRLAVGEVSRLVARSDELIQARVDAEAGWVAEHGQRMAQLSDLWRSSLDALRQDEDRRGQAAVDRLGQLEAALATHLATLGASLEAPMTRLLQTASEVPQAAAQVIAQLREEMTRLTERDNTALEERAAMMGQIHALLQAVNQAAGEQRAVVDSLVNTAGAALQQAGGHFAQVLQAQSDRASEASTHVAAGAVELASLGEAFSHGVDLFSQTASRLTDSLQRIEDAIGQSLVRSDEQLAYCVAQAREVIDLSISAQQGIVEDLRRLRAAPAALAEGSGA